MDEVPITTKILEQLAEVTYALAKETSIVVHDNDEVFVQRWFEDLRKIVLIVKSLTVHSIE